MNQFTTISSGTEQMKQETDPDQEEQFLTFQVSDETLALPVLKVRELIEVTKMTCVPKTGQFIKGVINLRGAVVPVIDLGSRLALSSCQLTRKSCILLTEIMDKEDHHLIGMLVDEVKEILSLNPKQRQPAPEFGTRIRNDFIEQIAQIEEQFVVILNNQRLLSIEELSQRAPGQSGAKQRSHQSNENCSAQQLSGATV